MPVYYEELLGSDVSEVYNRIFEKLKSNKPNLYKDSYVEKRLFFKQSLQSIQINLSDLNLEEFEILKNEILSSFLSHGPCKRIIFKQIKPTDSKLNLNPKGYSKKDISLPYFDI